MTIDQIIDRHYDIISDTMGVEARKRCDEHRDAFRRAMVLLVEIHGGVEMAMIELLEMVKSTTNLATVKYFNALRDSNEVLAKAGGTPSSLADSIASEGAAIIVEEARKIRVGLWKEVSIPAEEATAIEVFIDGIISEKNLKDFNSTVRRVLQ